MFLFGHHYTHTCVLLTLHTLTPSHSHTHSLSIHAHPTRHTPYHLHTPQQSPTTDTPSSTQILIAHTYTCNPTPRPVYDPTTYTPNHSHIIPLNTFHYVYASLLRHPLISHTHPPISTPLHIQLHICIPQYLAHIVLTHTPYTNSQYV